MALSITLTLLLCTKITASPFEDISISQSLIDQNQTYVGNITMFLPTNDAWSRVFNLTKDFNTTLFNNDTSQCYEILSLPDFKNLSNAELLPCLPSVALYHLARGRHGCLLTPNEESISIIPSLLNNTLDNQQIDQIIVANATLNSTTIVSGGNRTAEVLASYLTKEGGQIYFVDNVLFPPLPLNYTAAAMNFSYSNFTLPMANATAITAFAPLINGTMNGTIINANSYISMGQTIYINRNETSEILRAQDGSMIKLQVSSDGSAIVNDNLSIVQANIPLSNGVLHFINGTLNSTDMNIKQKSSWRLPTLLEHAPGL